MISFRDFFRLRPENEIEPEEVTQGCHAVCRVYELSWRV